MNSNYISKSELQTVLNDWMNEQHDALESNPNAFVNGFQNNSMAANILWAIYTNEMTVVEDYDAIALDDVVVAKLTINYTENYLDRLVREINADIFTAISFVRNVFATA